VISSINDCAVLKNGVRVPWLGLGTWQTPDGRDVANAVKWAVSAGYRHIDTAAAYYNESGVGTGIRECGVPRDKLFITTKLWNADQGYDSTLRAFDLSCKKLGLDVIDLYLIHWPVKGKYRDSWKAMEKLYKDKRVRAIGLSNFQVHHVEDVMKGCEVAPMVNQVEFHPFLTQKTLRAFCAKNGILFEAWSPLMHGHTAESRALAEISKRIGKSPAQVLIRWDLQHEVVTIPKSTHQQWIVENTKVYDFTLSAEDMAKLDGENRDHRFGPDPDNFNF
jgi:diketogulonate reductase-like aldo/keto reductase